MIRRVLPMRFIPPILCDRLTDLCGLKDRRYVAEPSRSSTASARSSTSTGDGTAHLFSRPGRELLRHAGIAWLREVLLRRCSTGRGCRRRHGRIQAISVERKRATGDMMVRLVANLESGRAKKGIVSTDGMPRAMRRSGPAIAGTEVQDMTKLARVLCFIALLPTAVMSLSMAQRNSAPDPTSLIGHWQGEWSISETGSSNRVSITVESVSANGDVVGAIYMAGPAAYHNRELNLRDATFRGGRLMFRVNENPNLVFDFAVKGNEMRAVLMGTSAPMQFVLKK
jgi:hypothetical protein